MMNIEVEDKLVEIENIVKDRFLNQTCYFRGEPKFYEIISASLHRNRKIMLPWYKGENPGMTARMVDGIKFDVPQRVTVLCERNPFIYHETRNFGFEIDIQNPESLYEMATIAGSFIKEDTKDLSDKEVDLGILQHLGYPTPYLDFTKCCLVSLFFACNGLPDEDGRIIILGDNGNYKFHDMTEEKFSVAKERAVAQKSVMLEKLELRKTEDNYIEYSIPCGLKPKILAYLEEHGINDASLFPDSWSYEREYNPYKKFRNK
ncbi:MAG: FRG domain-containing protein [Candidatus Poribacteria bacterium]|nr:FRG domain-containing protein [Candidatus Poribacteria bacterium]